MEQEVEIRVTLNQPEQALKKIKEKAEAKEKIKQKDDYFIPPNKDFFEEEPTRKYLRVRQEENQQQLGYHVCQFEDDGSLLYTEEYETKIGDAETVIQLLEQLGMRLKVTVNKQRYVFRYCGLELVVDRIKQLGCFLELEAKDISGTAQEKKKRCWQLLETLNLDWDSAPEQGYPDMILELES